MKIKNINNLGFGVIRIIFLSVQVIESIRRTKNEY